MTTAPDAPPRHPPSRDPMPGPTIMGAEGPPGAPPVYSLVP
jgi:hypothetical protein